MPSQPIEIGPEAAVRLPETTLSRAEIARLLSNLRASAARVQSHSLGNAAKIAVTWLGDDLEVLAAYLQS